MLELFSTSLFRHHLPPRSLTPLSLPCLPRSNWCTPTLFSPSPCSFELHFLSSSITLTTPHCFFPPLFFLVSFFPSYPSLRAIGTIFQAALNSTISSSHLASLSPSSSPFMPTAVDATGVLLTLRVYLCIYLCLPGIAIVTDFGAVCSRLPGRNGVPVHRPLGSDASSARRPCQLAYGAHIWASSIRDARPRGATVRPMRCNQFTEAPATRLQDVK